MDLGRIIFFKMVTKTQNERLGGKNVKLTIYLNNQIYLMHIWSIFIIIFNNHLSNTYVETDI